MAESSPLSQKPSPNPHPNHAGSEPDHLDHEPSMGRSKDALRVLERSLPETSRAKDKHPLSAQKYGAPAGVDPMGGLNVGEDNTAMTDLPRETPRRMAVHLGIGLLVCAALLAGYLTWARRTHNVKTLVVQAVPLILQGDTPSLREAESKLTQALTIDGDNDRAMSALAEVYALLWIDHGFAADAEKAKDYAARSVKANVATAERYAAEGLVALGEGRAKDAETLLTKVIEQGAVSEKIHYVLGLAERDVGQFKAGRDALRRAQEATSGAAHFALALGDAYDADGDATNAGLYWQMSARASGSYVPGVARDVIRRVRRGEPAAKLNQDLDRLQLIPADQLGSKDTAAIAEARAALLYREGDLAKASAILQNTISTAGETPRLLLLKGQVLLGLGQIEAGLAALGKAQELSHNAPRAMYSLVDAYVTHKQFDKGLAQIARAEKDLGASADLDVAKGDLYLAASDYAKAAQAYDAALKRDDSNALALVGRGIVARDQKQMDQAREWFEKAVTADSKLPQVYQAVGMMWIMMGALKEANLQLEMADQLYKAQGTDAVQRRRFYAQAVKYYSAAKGGAGYGQQWKSKLGGI